MEYMSALKNKCASVVDIMAQSDLHPVLTYNSNNNVLTTLLYNQYNEPNVMSAVVYTTNTAYTWFRNNIQVATGNDPFLIIHPPECSDEYSVTVEYQVTGVVVNNSLDHQFDINDVVNGDIIIMDGLNTILNINNNVSGSVIFSGTSNIIINTMGVLNINGQIFGGIVIATTIDSEIAGSLNNGNATNACSGGDLIIPSGAIFERVLTVSGFLTNQNHTLTVSSTGPHSAGLIITGTLVNNSVGDVGLSGIVSTGDIIVNGTLNNFGTIFSSGLNSLVVNNNAINNSGAGIFTIGTLTQFNNNSTGLVTIADNAIFTINANGAVNSGTINLKQNGILAINGNGTLSNISNINTADQSSIQVGTSVTGGTLINNGSINLYDTSFLLITNNSSIFVNNVANVINLNDNSSINLSNVLNVPNVINAGNINISTNASLNIYNISVLTQPGVGKIANNGHINIYDGSSLLSATGTTITNKNIINVFPGGLLDVVGATFTGNSPIGSGTVLGTFVDTATPNTVGSNSLLNVVGTTVFIDPNFASTNMFGGVVGTFIATNTSTGTLTFPQIAHPFNPNMIPVGISNTPSTGPVVFTGSGSFVLDQITNQITSSVLVITFTNLLILPAQPTCPGFVPQTYSNFTNIITGTNFIIDERLIQQNSSTLTVSLPFGVTTDTYAWAYNYKILPSTTNSITVVTNGIYEVSFVDTSSNTPGFTYYSAIEVTNLTLIFYAKIIGNDRNIYGTIVGFTSITKTLFFSGVGGTAPYRFKIYVNDILVTTIPTLPITTLVAGDIISVVVTDCCGNHANGNTFELTC